jgi:cyanophycinase
MFCENRSFLICTFLLVYITATGIDSSYQYIRIGNKDVETKPTAGIAMMGGGADLDDAFRWLCRKANGGDFLILRARGSDDYNSYVNGLCKLNSVATLIISNRAAAQEPAVANIIREAEAVFIAGGDQARYFNSWKGTAVQNAINADVAHGVPIGGTSAGLAVLGQFAYGALADKADDKDLDSIQVLLDPFVDRVTLVRDFLWIHLLGNTLTDSHFVTRDRMGRSLGFLARIEQDGWSKDPREIAIDEKSAVLVDDDGKATIIGTGAGAYFIHPLEPPKTCKKGSPLTFRRISIYKAPSGAQFDLLSWDGSGGTSYLLSVEEGRIHSTQSGEAIY